MMYENLILPSRRAFQEHLKCIFRPLESINRGAFLIFDLNFDWFFSYKPSLNFDITIMEVFKCEMYNLMGFFFLF